jgi:hypothetical protein
MGAEEEDDHVTHDPDPHQAAPLCTTAARQRRCPGIRLCQTSPAPAAGQEPLVISQSTNAALQKYLAHLSEPARRLCRQHGWSQFLYHYCPEIACTHVAVRWHRRRNANAERPALPLPWHSSRAGLTVAATKSPTGRHGIKRGTPTEELPVFRHMD